MTSDPNSPLVPPFGVCEQAEKRLFRVEDEVFASFCQAVGCETIRDFEEGRLKRVEEQTARRLALNTQVRLDGGGVGVCGCLWVSVPVSMSFFLCVCLCFHLQPPPRTISCAIAKIEN